MRNLKKFLALMMALVMAVSLMVTVNAAEVRPSTGYNDASNITEGFAEAVDVLTGMGVFGGDGGNFKPGESITRAEMAAIIYRLHSGDVSQTQDGLYTGAVEFTDVHNGDWFAPYVGYCANGTMIKGYDDGSFRPNGYVTGYEALAMMMRAVGYDANGEFTGADWRIKVATYAQQLGITDDVKATVYGSTLNGPARRDVIASMLLATAQLPQVTWSPLGGYNKYNNNSLVQGGAGILENDNENDSLGYQNFGLTLDYGIVVGDQATGEGSTRIARTTWRQGEPGRTNANLSYAWASGKTFDVKNGLELFGHRVKVWYKHTTTGGTNDANAWKVYALYDDAVLAKTVKADKDGEKLDKTQADAASKIARAARDAGFTIPTKSVALHESVSFSRMTDVAADAAITAGTQDSLVWVLISNNDDKNVDVVIPVQCEINVIDKVNNQSASKTFSVSQTNTKDVLTIGTTCAQGDVMNPEAIKLGDTVIITKVPNRTDTNAASPVYWIDTPTKTVTGTVVTAEKDGTTHKTVTLSNGTELKRTIIDNAAIEQGAANVADDATACNKFAFATYEFTLDMQGNWISAKRVYDNRFVYGTYLDYNTTLGTSTFTYRLVGVGLDGKQVTADVTKYRLDNGASGATGSFTNFNGAAGNDMGAVGMPYHNVFTADGLVARSATIKYKGFIIKGTGMDNEANELYAEAGIQSLVDDHIDGAAVNFISDASNNTELKKSDLDMTVKEVKLSGTFNGTSTATSMLYMTEHTKFYVVSGYGTDGQTVKTYTGITELLDGANSVTIKTSQVANGGFADEILFTESDYVYSNIGTISRQVNTMFIPSNALEYDRGNNLTFFHKVTSDILNPDDPVTNAAKLFTAYQNGEKVSVWIEAGANGQTNLTNGGADKFYRLTPTSNKAADGNIIYKASVALASTEDDQVASASNTIVWTKSGAGVEYHGDTNNGLTAWLEGTPNNLVRVGDAKIVNLVTDKATIENLAQLNDLASVKTVKVCVSFDGGQSRVVNAIYVIDVT